MSGTTWTIRDEISRETLSSPSKATALATLTMLMSEHRGDAEFRVCESRRLITVRRAARAGR